FSSCFSDTGTKPPESGIFGFMINISALLGVVTMYIRYLLIEKQNESSHFIRSSCNMLSLCIGLMGCIGMGIVATFQELSVPSVHDIGALVAFGSGVVYITLQSIISYKSCPQWNTYFVCHIRMAISVISSIAFIPMIVFASRISMTKIDWTPGEKDYTYHFVSAICEWTVAFGFIFFFLTFIRDFQVVSLRISTEIHED
ncbi:DNA damage-regulated autophagy modulator protein 1, partial [Cariama cristata]